MPRAYRPTVKYSIADKLRQSLLSGDIATGQQLPSERTLAAEYDVARNTVREAVRLLELEGLVVTEHGRGSFAAMPTVETFDGGAPIAPEGLSRSEKAALSKLGEASSALLAFEIISCIGRSLTHLSDWVSVSRGRSKGSPAEIEWRNGPIVLDVVHRLIPRELGGRISGGIPGLRLMGADTNEATLQWLAYDSCFAVLTRSADPGVEPATFRPAVLPPAPWTRQLPTNRPDTAH